MPGAIQHPINRVIERQRVFLDDLDRNNFGERLGSILASRIILPRRGVVKSVRKIRNLPPADDVAIS